MTAQIQLSEEEIAFIEAKRQADEAQRVAEEAERKAREAQKAAKKVEAEKKRLADLKIHLSSKANMAKDLEEADKDNILDFNWSQHDETGQPVCNITYTHGNSIEHIRIVEHYKRERYSSSQFAGWRYETRDHFSSGYRDRKYKNVKTLLTRVAEFQEAANNSLAREWNTQQLVEMTKKHLEKKFPHAITLEHKEPCGWKDHTAKFDHTYHITTAKGLVVFRSHIKDDKLVLVTHKVVPTDKVRKDLEILILKG